MKVMLTYPPGLLYQRGEDRCQGNIENSSASAMRACNDLGYCAAALLERGYQIFLKDYQTERKSLDDVIADVRTFQPDLLMVSITNTTIYDDIKFAAYLKELCNAVIVLKGALFYKPDQEMLDLLDLSKIDYLVGGEAELSIAPLADYALRGLGKIEDVDNILYKDSSGRMVSTKFDCWQTDLDSIAFPARQYMNNGLYLRPDTKEPMATIQTSRGCPSNCIYCMSPMISGKKLRLRSPQNVMAELEECYYEFGIKNFFFKADTFTLDAEWTKTLCQMIINSPLHGKIQFTANSRTNPLQWETLHYMKKAGCFAVAFGFESGSPETMRLIKKGSTVEYNLQASRWARELGLKIFGFFVVGFPWENEEHLALTQQHIMDLDPDFLELYIALPYYGTKLYDLCRDSDLLGKATLGSDYFNSNTIGTSFLTQKQLLDFRSRLILKYYFRPSYIWRRLMDCFNNPSIFFSYAYYARHLLTQSKA